MPWPPPAPTTTSCYPPAGTSWSTASVRRKTGAAWSPRSTTPARIGADSVAFDNKLNVLHRGNAGLPEHLAKGLAVFLNSTAVDAYFRQFSGHTQVNAGDLRSLRFPPAGVLERLGHRVDGIMPAPEEINRLVGQEVFEMNEGDDPIEVKERVDATKAVLKALKAPKVQRKRPIGAHPSRVARPRPRDPLARRERNRYAASPSSWTGWHRAMGRGMPPIRGRPSGASPCTSSCRWGLSFSIPTILPGRPTARRTSTGSSRASSRFSGVTGRMSGPGRSQLGPHPSRGTTGSRSRRAPWSTFRSPFRTDDDSISPRADRTCSSRRSSRSSRRASRRAVT